MDEYACADKAAEYVPLWRSVYMCVYCTGSSQLSLNRHWSDGAYFIAPLDYWKRGNIPLVLGANQAVCSCPIFRVQVNWMIKLFKPWPWANYLWVGEEVSLEFMAGLTGRHTWSGRLQFRRQLKEKEKVEGQWSFWELAWQKVYWHYSFIVRPLSPGSLSSFTLDQKKKHTCVLYTHSHRHTLLDIHAFSPTSLKFEAWSCSTSGNMRNTNIFLWQLHAVHTVYVSMHAHTHTHSALVGEESLTFSSITIWKGGYTDAVHQWKCITRPVKHRVFDLLEATWYGAQNNDVHPYGNTFPCQHCMKFMC